MKTDYHYHDNKNEDAIKVDDDHHHADDSKKEDNMKIDLSHHHLGHQYVDGNKNVNDGNKGDNICYDGNYIVTIFFLQKILDCILGNGKNRR